MGAEEYPYDPLAVPEMQRGLDKLRCIEDRRIAREAYDLFLATERNATDPGFHRRERARVARTEQAELEQLTKLANAAFAGAYGADGKSLVAAMLIDQDTWGNPRRTDIVSLRVFAKELRELRKGAA